MRRCPWTDVFFFSSRFSFVAGCPEHAEVEAVIRRDGEVRVAGHLTDPLAPLLGPGLVAVAEDVARLPVNKSGQFRPVRLTGPRDLIVYRVDGNQVVLVFQPFMQDPVVVSEALIRGRSEGRYTYRACVAAAGVGEPREHAVTPLEPQAVLGGEQYVSAAVGGEHAGTPPVHLAARSPAPVSGVERDAGARVCQPLLQLAVVVRLLLIVSE
ncbi:MULTISPECIES: hypothetical protein [unclassified Streptomyces]|uniref:hypothetical protein n=1 Tax=unclassified Streptomyces TaxID=2593676 RepID=UPI00362B6F03